MRRNPFKRKLAEALDTSLDRDVVELVRLAESKGRFDSALELDGFLCEGVMLNINAFAAQSLLIPPGKYMVTVRDAGHSVLVPMSDLDESITSIPPSYDISTERLLGVWNRLERVIGEDKEEMKADDDDFDRNIRNKTVFQTKEPGRIHPIDQQVASSYTSTSLSQEEIADEIGVHPSTVSRWKTKGKKSGRTPTLAHALELSSLTGVPVDAMMASKAGTTKPRKKTSGSGGGRNTAYRQGNSDENDD